MPTLTIYYTPPADLGLAPEATEVLLAGSWDAWAARRAMLYVPAERRWLLTVDVDAGDRAARRVWFKFVVNGVWACDMLLPSDCDAQGNVNNYADVRMPAEDSMGGTGALWLAPSFAINSSAGSADAGKSGGGVFALSAWKKDALKSSKSDATLAGGNADKAGEKAPWWKRVFAARKRPGVV